MSSAEGEDDVGLEGGERSSVASSEDGERCRICYEGGGLGEKELVRPCACSGSMEWIHKGCLLRWLTSSPAVVSRGCDVCDSSWREDLVKKPSLRRFLRDLAFGSRGEIAARRFLRHISTIPRFSEEAGAHEDVLFEEGAHDDEVDELLAVDDGAHHGEAGGALAFGLEDAWEAIGLLAPAGGGVEELNGAAAAIVRLAIWSMALWFAVAQGRASLKLFAYGVRAVLVLDSRVDALLLPGSVADYLEVVFPGLPCLQRAARFVRNDVRDQSTSLARAKGRWRRFGSLVRAFVGTSRRRSRADDRRLSFARRIAAWFHSANRPAASALPLPKSKPIAQPPLARAARLLLQLARGPWRVDDVFVGFVALALDVRGLARFVRGNRIFHRAHAGVGRQALVALARIATSPEAVAHDVATVFEHLVSSPLLVVHWLAVFPSYVYALRLALARMGVLSADERVRLALPPSSLHCPPQVLDLENGEGVAFHLSLLAVAASATTCVAALAHSLHSEYVAWTADHSLASLRAPT